MSYVVFQELFDAAPPNYAEQLLSPNRAATSDGQDQANLAQFSRELNSITTVSLPVFAQESSFFQLNAAQMRLIEISKQCALADLMTSAPLLAGEKIVSDVFSYLTESFDDVPAGTAILLRETNFSRIIHVFEGIEITDAGLVRTGLLPAAPASDADVQPLEGIASTILTTILKEAAGAIGSQIGAAIFKEISSALFGNDTEKLVESIRSVVKGEIVKNEIESMEGGLQAFIDYLISDYLVRKSKKDLTNVANRKELFDAIKPYSTSLFEIMGRLKQESVARSGLNTYMTGATLHLTIFQELALVDPDAMDPNQSSYLETLRIRASAFSNHISRTFNGILADRLEKIVLERFSTTVDVDHRSITRDWVVFRDSEAGIDEIWGDDKNGNNYNKLKAQYDIHRAKVKKELTDQHLDTLNSIVPHLNTMASGTFHIKV